eukprot:4692879-Pyramimonas_sp.AAC.1
MELYYRLTSGNRPHSGIEKCKREDFGKIVSEAPCVDFEHSYACKELYEVPVGVRIGLCRVSSPGSRCL